MNEQEKLEVLRGYIADVGEMPTPDVPHYVGATWEHAPETLARTGGDR